MTSPSPARPPLAPTPPAVYRDALTVRQVITTAIGRATMAWENVSGAGVFDSDYACLVADELIEWLATCGLTGDQPVDSAGLAELDPASLAVAAMQATDQERYARARMRAARAHTHSTPGPSDDRPIGAEYECGCSTVYRWDGMEWEPT